MLRSAFFALGLAAAALVLGSCSTDAPIDLAADELGLPDYSLHYLDMGDTARLAYGAADSDAVRLMFECAKGSGRIEASDIATLGPRLVLASGAARMELEGRLEPGVASPVVYAGTTADTPVIDAFGRSGRLRVGEGEGHYQITATAEDRLGVDSFLAACTTA